MKPSKLGTNPLKNIERGGMSFKKLGKAIPIMTKPTAINMYPKYFTVFPIEIIKHCLNNSLPIHITF